MSEEGKETLLTMTSKTSKKSRFWDQVAELVRRGLPERRARDMVAAKELCSRLRRELAGVKKELGEARKEARMDSLTGLLNRRGLIDLGNEQLKIANRVGRRVWVLFADFDHLKKINDALGHEKGDEALIDVANVLRKTFRESDLIARTGGDEFVILAVETDQDIENKEAGPIQAMKERLQENMVAFNETGDCLYKLSLSIGAEPREAGDSRSLGQLINAADGNMYKSKQV